MYPTYNGKPLDELNQKRFDYWKDRFKFALLNSKQEITDAKADTLAHNCACQVVWDYPSKPADEETYVQDV